VVFIIGTIPSLKVKKKKQSFAGELVRNRALFIMMIPGLFVLLINNYLPMLGVYLAFIKFKFTTPNFIKNLITSPWVGLKNFEFFTATQDAFHITRNTVLYNLSFIIIGTIAGIAVVFLGSHWISRICFP
jgi:putative aldouronate transport system permease protein